jgi:hypothetical protein
VKSGKKVPVSVLIPSRNEAQNIGRCLASLGWADEIVVVDSQSTDDTLRIAESFGAQTVQFGYEGGWPKKRQWALDTYLFRNDWILLLDADEIVSQNLAEEIERVIADSTFTGYYLRFQIYFLGRQLKFGGSDLWKLVLFRRGSGRFECRVADQDKTMGDVEVHEHFILSGPSAKLRHSVRHENINSLYRYIEKHNEYSNWEAVVIESGVDTELRPTPWGNQAQRRRWLKRAFLGVPGSPAAMFLYKYVGCLGALDGVPGLIYCGMQAIQMFHIKANVYEIRQQGTNSCAATGAVSSPAAGAGSRDGSGRQPNAAGSASGGMTTTKELQHRGR